MTKRILAAAIAIGMATSAGAQTLQVAERAPDASSIVALYQGVAPGSEAATWREQVSNPVGGWGGGRLVRNVVQPTLTIFKPANPAANTGAAVLIAPGGGFRWLSIDSEGYDVARALAAKGITAIVLKYRLDRTPTAESDFQKSAAAFIGAVANMGKAAGSASGPTPAMPKPPAADGSPTKPGIADGLAAITYIRAHAAEWGIDPKRIGMIGFSAGGSVTMGTLLNYTEASRPDFVGLIYAPGAAGAGWKPDTPPIFNAVASDDFLADIAIAAYSTQRAAKIPSELHVYTKGGHGFGMTRKGLTTDLWLDELVAWVGSLGFLTQAN